MFCGWNYTVWRFSLWVGFGVDLLGNFNWKWEGKLSEVMMDSDLINLLFLIVPIKRNGPHKRQETLRKLTLDKIKILPFVLHHSLPDFKVPSKQRIWKSNFHRYHLFQQMIFSFFLYHNKIRYWFILIHQSLLPTVFSSFIVLFNLIWSWHWLNNEKRNLYNFLI